MFTILALNLGGTSAKAAVYEDDKCAVSATIDYFPDDVLAGCPGTIQLERKKKYFSQWFDSINLNIEDIDAFAVRLGGMFYGGDGGTFLIEGDIRKQVDKSYDPGKPLKHATRLTMALVDELQKDLEVKRPSFATDPSSINQYLPETRITGCPLFAKLNSFHALSHRAVARKAAEEIGKTYETANIIVVHMGGGISIGAHEKGRVIDVNDSTGVGEGPFSTDRAGTVPSGQVMKLCYSGKYTEKEAHNLLVGESGLKGYLGTDDLREVEKRIDNGDEYAELILRALAYQIAREVGACYATLCGEVDVIVMTAGMAKSERLFNMIKARVDKIAPMLRYTGDYENEALALGAYRVLSGKETPAVYQGEGNHVQVYAT